MSLADELEKLGQLHRMAQLSDEEFSRAKEKLLSSLGKEASSFSANTTLMCCVAQFVIAGLVAFAEAWRYIRIQSRGFGD